MANNPDYHKTGINLDLPDFSKELETLNNTKQKFRDICVKYKQDSITATTPFNKYPDVINGLIAGGGVQPSEDITITSNGTYSVIGLRNAIINVPTSVESSTFTKMINNGFSSTDALALPDGITSVRNYAFYQLSSLKAIDLTNCTSIGQYAFQGSGVTNLTIPSTVTSVSSYAIANNTSLKTVTLANNTFSQYEFYGDTALESVSVNTTQTSIPSYMFQNCYKLKSFPFEKFTIYNSYSFNNAGSNNSADDAMDVITTNSTYLGSYAFSGANIKTANINLDGKYLYQYTFQNTKNTESIELRNWNTYSGGNTSYGYYLFSNSSVKSIEMNSIESYYNPYMFCNATKVEKLSGITPKGTVYYDCFNLVGSARADTSKQLKIDLSKATSLTTLQYRSFAGLVNTEVTLPSSVTTMSSYSSSQGAFNNCKQLRLVLNSIPAIGSYTFSNNTDLLVFTPYTNVVTLRETTNWTTYVDNIMGYIDTTDTTTELPLYLDDTAVDKIDCCWYTGTDLATQVETIESNTRYFCKTGPFYCTDITAINNTMAITDSEGNTYASGDRIIYGTDLTITFAPDEGKTIPYTIIINGEDVKDQVVDNQITYKMGISLSITALYWDGENEPYNPDFSKNSWGMIAQGIKSRVGFSVGWKIGDTKTITTTEGYTFTIRLCDTQAGRYTKADGTKTNAVLEFVEGYPKYSALNNSTKESYYTGGGWAACDMNTSEKNLGTLGNQYGVLSMKAFLKTLPEDLQAIIPSVSLLGYSFTGQSPRTATSQLFLPTTYEVQGHLYYANLVDKNSNLGDDYQQFDLYKEKGATALQKYRLNSTSSDWFWLRSPGSGYRYSFCLWQGSDYGSNYANYSRGVAPVFAL